MISLLRGCFINAESITQLLTAITNNNTPQGAGGEAALASFFPLFLLIPFLLRRFFRPVEVVTERIEWLFQVISMLSRNMKDIIYLKLKNDLFQIPTEYLAPYQKRRFFPQLTKELHHLFSSSQCRVNYRNACDRKGFGPCQHSVWAASQDPPQTALRCYALEIMNVETQAFPMFVFQS